MKIRVIAFTITIASLIVAGFGLSLRSTSASGTWTTKAPMPDGRVGVASGVIGGKIFIAGGSPINTTAIYDASADSWSYAAGTMNTSRAFISSGVIGGNLYAAEGWNGSDSSSPTTALEMYDPVADLWTFGPSSLVARGNCASAVIDDKLYITGGASNGYAVVFDQLEVFDPSVGTWSLQAPIPIGVPGQSGAAIDGKLYVVGGYSPIFPVGTRDDLQIYDPATNTWTIGPPMPTARSEAFAAVLGGKLYVVGGNTNTAAGALSVVEMFDPSTNTWSTETSAPTARSIAAGGVIGSTMYVTGGYDPTFRQENEAFTAENSPSPTPTPSPTPAPSPTPTPESSPSPTPGPSPTPQIGPPTDKDQCKNGGWQIFNTPRPFRNQGDCIQFVNNGH